MLGRRSFAGLAGLWIALLLCGWMRAQVAAGVPAPAGGKPELSPGAAYTEAVLPLQTTRQAVANWSATEQAALGVAIQRAAAACLARTPAEYAGEALTDLVKLCALGQAWPVVIDAADRYIGGDGAKPQLGEAYAGKADAQMRMKDEAGALKTAEEMIAAVPYGAVVADASNEAIDYMELLHTKDAVAVAAAREGKILAALQEVTAVRAGVVAAAAAGVGSAGSVGVADLYRQGLVLAGLEQLSGRMEEARATVAALEGAVPGSATVDEKVRMAASRRRYEQLGKPLVDLGLIASLRRPGTLPELPARDAVTALLLFPDWCAQCVALAKRMPESVFTVGGHEAYVYGLLAETVKPEKLAASATGQAGFKAALAAELLRETPTVTVPLAVLDRFDGSEVPLLIVADARGVVRLIEPVDESALLPGKTVDAAIALVGGRWPGVKRVVGRPKGQLQPAGRDARPRGD